MEGKKSHRIPHLDKDLDKDYRLVMTVEKWRISISRGCPHPQLIIQYKLISPNIT